jgi:uncharacterized RDD family membrane protein YckC
MSVLAVSTPFNIDLELVIAPFGRRMFAWLLDSAILVVYFYGFYSIVYSKLSFDEGLAAVVWILGFGIPWAMYDFLQEYFFNGQSIGKRALGIRVVDLQGNEPSASQCILRQVLRTVDFTITLGLCALISSLISKNGQRVGDVVAGTLVIEKTPRANLTETIYIPVERETYQVRFPAVMRLTDRDINGIRTLLAAKPTRDTMTYAATVSLRIQTVLGIETDLEPRDFMQQLLEDYNFLSAH